MREGTRDRLAAAINEQDVARAYRDEIAHWTGAAPNSPARTDGLAVWKAGEEEVRLLMEFKEDRRLKDRREFCAVLCQVVHYIKNLKRHGAARPNVILVADRNEYALAGLNMVRNFLEWPGVDWSAASSTGCPVLRRALVDGLAALPWVHDVTETSDFRGLMLKAALLAQGVRLALRPTLDSLATIFGDWSQLVLRDTTLGPAEVVDTFFRWLVDPAGAVWSRERPHELHVSGYAEAIRVDPDGMASFIGRFRQGVTPSDLDAFLAIRDTLLDDEHRRRKGGVLHAQAMGGAGARRPGCHARAGLEPGLRGVGSGGRAVQPGVGSDVRPACAVHPGADGRGRDPATEEAPWGRRVPVGLPQPGRPNEGLPSAGGGRRVAAMGEGGAEAGVPDEPAVRDGRQHDHQRRRKQGGNRQDRHQRRHEEGEAGRTVPAALRAVHVPLRGGGGGAGLQGVHGRHVLHADVHVLGELPEVPGVVVRATRLPGWVHLPGVALPGAVRQVGRELHRMGLRRDDPPDAEPELAVLDVEGDEVIEVGRKSLYNSDGREASRCVRDPVKDLKGVDAPQFTSGLRVVERLGARGTLVPGALGYMVLFGNNIRDANDGTYPLSSTSSRSHGCSFLPANFRRVVALFAARKLILETWLTQKDEYLVPDESAEGYGRWADDCHVWLLLHRHNNCTAMRDVPYKGRNWRIDDNLFWIRRDEATKAFDEAGCSGLYQDAKAAERRGYEPHMASALEGMGLSKDAMGVLDRMDALWRKSLPTREAFARERPELHLHAWDAGVYQLKHLWRAHLPAEWEELRAAWKLLGDRLRDGVYAYGFLRR